MSYDWVTEEMFDSKFREIVGGMSTDQLLAVPGVYEALKEDLNNQVLEELEDENPPDARDESRWPEPTEEEPDVETMERWVYDGVAEATDGCTVEPDGMCEHHHPSWLIRLELI